MAEPIKMTRAEYEAKFGTVPSVPVAPVTTPATPEKSSAPIKMTRAEYQAKFGVEPTVGPAPTEKPGYFERVGEEIKGAFQGAKKTTERGAELMQEGKPVQGAVMSGLGAPAAVLRAAFAPVTAAVAPVIEATGIAETAPVKALAQKASEFAAEHPDLAQNIQSVAEIGTALTGTKAAGTLGRTVAPTVSRATKTVARAAETGAEAVKTGAGMVTPIVRGAADVTRMAGEGLARVPSRIGVNVAEKQAVEKAITSLPHKTAQEAVRSGVDIVDAKVLPDLVTTPEAKTLIQTVKDFAAGNRKVDPIEIVGRPIIKRVKELDHTRKIVGAQLGAASKKIGILTKPELQNGIIARIKKVPGLENATLNEKGMIDFKGTTFGTTLSRADKNAVQEAFREATKWGDGEKAHLFRQTLFENLGGKKRSLANISATHEKALEAIRDGLADVIEPKSLVYKKLSKEYAKIVSPLSDLRKLMKNIDPASSEDILNMSAGLLARRITSAATSNPQIRQLLEALDEAGVKGATKESVTKMQDLYNILNKNYDIAPKTGFQNLVKEGVGIPGGLYEAATGAIKGFAGTTNAVRQAALEKYLDELLKASKP